MSNKCFLKNLLFLYIRYKQSIDCDHFYAKNSDTSIIKMHLTFNKLK